MTSQEKDKFICEKLGICWHEWKSDHASFTCIKCGYRCNSSETPPKNPDFTSEAGRVQLLKLIKPNKRYYHFCERYLIFSCWEHRKKIYAIPEPLMTDDTGEFRDAVFEWLGGEE